jgi:hypothetical protein
MGNGGIDSFVFNFGTNLSEWSVSRLGNFTRGERTPAGFQRRSGRGVLEEEPRPCIECRPVRSLTATLIEKSLFLFN